MKNRFGKFFLANVLSLSMLFSMTTGATEPNVVNQSENTYSESSVETDAVNGENDQAEYFEVLEDDQTEEVEEVEVEEIEETEEMDEKTQELEEVYHELLKDVPVSIAALSYETELEKFPSSYQSFLTKLHDKFPKWIFVAVDTGIDWNTLVKEESVSGKSSETNQSLLEKNTSSLYLSKNSTDFSKSTGKYIPKDGSTWFSASKNAVAHTVDPRNFLVEKYIYQFEALSYNKSYHTESGVEAILKGTDLYKKTISYINTSGKTVNTNTTYGQAILAAGVNNGVSPLFLASRIRQETGAKLTNGSISGNYNSTYRGYYNYYNIGAYATTTGSAVANGLKYAKNKGWTSPLLAIDGGAKWIASSYISKGQNTLYFEKFNVTYKPYFEHQYMQNLLAPASEGYSTYSSYSNMGTLSNANVFYVPVYKNMPSRSTTISIPKTVKTAIVDKTNTMRTGAATSYGSVTSVPAGSTVTVLECVHTSKTASISNQELYPYWAKVKYGSKEGYICMNYLSMKKNSSVKIGDTVQLGAKASKSGENIYYMSSNPAIAQINSKGEIKGYNKGTCTIYAFNSAATKLDAVGISVGSTTSVTSAPKMNAVKNYNGYIRVKWNKVSGASGYYVYRKQSGGSWVKIKKITSGSTIKYDDKEIKSNTLYVYTVKYIKNGKKSAAAEKLKIRYLKTPVLVSAVNETDGVKFTWKKVTGANQYQIYRKLEGGKFSKIATVTGNTTVSYLDTEVEKEKIYYYTVYASDGTYRSYYSKNFQKVKR